MKQHRKLILLILVLITFILSAWSIYLRLKQAARMRLGDVQVINQKRAQTNEIATSS